MKPNLKASGPERLRLSYDELLSTVAFKFNLRRYTKLYQVVDEVAPGGGARGGKAAAMGPTGRGLHSFTFQLNLTAFCGTRGAFRGCLGGV
jgi:hypothetical protein